MAASMIEGVVRAPDGRRVGYAVHGAAEGRAVVFCHGGPGSRLSSLGTPELLAERGIRLVGIDRPGQGLSDVRPGWRLPDWPDDADLVVDHLGIDRYVVAGVSAGSRCALACGAGRPDAVEEVVVVAGVLPPSWYPGDELVALAAQDPDAARATIRRDLEPLAGDVEAAVAAMGTRPEPDGPVYRRPEVREQFLATYREAFRSGIEGCIHDVLLCNLPWAFELVDVTVPVHWWHGALDRVTTSAAVQQAVGDLPNHTLTVVDDAGHTVGITHADTILRTLVPGDA